MGVLFHGPMGGGIHFSSKAAGLILRLQLESQDRLPAGFLASLEKFRPEGRAHFDLVGSLGIDSRDAGNDIRPFRQLHDPHNIGFLSAEAFLGHQGRGYNDAGKSSQFPVPFELHPFHLAPETGYAYGPGRHGQGTTFFAPRPHDFPFIEKLFVGLIVERLVIHEVTSSPGW
jgi:hypothetical protein